MLRRAVILTCLVALFTGAHGLGSHGDAVEELSELSEYPSLESDGLTEVPARHLTTFYLPKLHIPIIHKLPIIHKPDKHEKEEGWDDKEEGGWDDKEDDKKDDKKHHPKGRRSLLGGPSGPPYGKGKGKGPGHGHGKGPCKGGPPCGRGPPKKGGKGKHGL